MKELFRFANFLLVVISTTFFSNHQLLAQGFFVNVSEIDSMRVRIMADHSNKPLEIRAWGGLVYLITDKGRSISLDTTMPPIILDLRNKNRIEFAKRGEDKQFCESMTIYTIDTSLVSILHPDIPRRYYTGIISVENVDGKWTMINRVGIEDYVTSVIAGEMPFEHQEALKTQATIARTYALWNLARSKKRVFDLDDHTGSQVYIGEPIFKPRFRKAAYATMGNILLWGGKIVLAAYFSTSGGTTTNNEYVWSGQPLPYLRSINDGDASAKSPHYYWEYGLKKSSFAKTFGMGFNDELRIIEKDLSGRVTRIRAGKNWTGQEFRLKMISTYGPLSLKSTLFDIKYSGDSLYFVGRGLGHGVGLSQWGALGLAESGWTATDIMKLYYKGVEVVNYHALNTEKLYLAE